MTCLSAHDLRHAAAILALTGLMGMTTGAPVSAQAPPATSVTSQHAVGTVTNNSDAGAVSGSAAADRFSPSQHADQFSSAQHVAVEVLCLDASVEAVQPLFIGTNMVCAPK